MGNYQRLLEAEGLPEAGITEVTSTADVTVVTRDSGERFVELIRDLEPDAYRHIMDRVIQARFPDLYTANLGEEQ
jgi:PleD family two-component response regulator